MKIADFFVELGIKTNKQQVKEIENTISKLEALEKQVDEEIKREKELAKAETEEQKAKIKKKHAIQDEIKQNKKVIETQKQSIANFKGMIKGALGLVTAITTVVAVADRMVTSLANANQKIVNFQRTTGISLDTLNRYAQANVMSNPLATIEGTAGSLSNLASNLWDIQLGRGDVSAFQELSFFSGQDVSPYGKSITEVIESVRSALKNIDNDVQATNLITRMGFSPDDLMMLRMSREEFEKIDKLFLSSAQREQMADYNRELKKLHLQMALLKDELLLKLFPILLKIEHIAYPILKVIKGATEGVLMLVNGLTEIPFLIKGIGIALGVLLAKAHPLVALLSSLMVIIEDLAGYYSGKKSGFGVLMYALDELKSKNPLNVLTLPEKLTENLTRTIVENYRNRGASNTDNRVNNITVNTNNPAVANSVIEMAQSYNMNGVAY